MTAPPCSRLQLPTELLRQIVAEYVHCESVLAKERAPHGPRRSYKPAWKVVQSLSLAAKALRQLALEAWFEVYFAPSPEALLQAWPECGSWTRELHCVELGTDLQAPPLRHWDYRTFHRLRKLRVDFDPAQSNASLVLRFETPRYITSQITTLELFDISWPSPKTLEVIARAFPNIENLKLAQDLIWCNLCNICRFATFKDPPPAEISYDKVVGLPTHYATYLKALIRLHTFTLSIVYGLGGFTSLSKGNENLWTGECDACMDIMYAIDDFRCDWVEQKKMIERPPALKLVKWQFRQKNEINVAKDEDSDGSTLLDYTDQVTTELDE
ncbi:uncharacterized protein BXZ73DRAFT_104837 [Epithele typhae]|uniref:uncharacterized protein n=1 Tax=Epithele typhae TaxID=378194 RepID=UPI002007D65E|nr:uncharacterized protein BXZ73DRAFT_104837 [Epithele typhae]KAH9920020.1 hypothetical protein BXZ73DRAFT_104837 [Epithele typhae]